MESLSKKWVVITAWALGAKHRPFTTVCCHILSLSNCSGNLKRINSSANVAFQRVTSQNYDSLSFRICAQSSYSLIAICWRTGENLSWNFRGDKTQRSFLRADGRIRRLTKSDVSEIVILRNVAFYKSPAPAVCPRKLNWEEKICCG